MLYNKRRMQRSTRLLRVDALLSETTYALVAALISSSQTLEEKLRDTHLYVAGGSFKRDGKRVRFDAIIADRRSQIIETDATSTMTTT